MNKIYDAVNAKVKAQGGLVYYLFKKGLETKKYYMENYNTNYHWFYDNVVFNKVHTFGPSLIPVGQEEHRLGRCSSHHQRFGSSLHGSPGLLESRSRQYRRGRLWCHRDGWCHRSSSRLGLLQWYVFHSSLSSSRQHWWSSSLL